MASLTSRGCLRFHRRWRHSPLYDGWLTLADHGLAREHDSAFGMICGNVREVSFAAIALMMASCPDAKIRLTPALKNRYM